ncbi:hypothetical protein ACFQLX_02350 [Streptomyces polyrhachis]|uniref:Uncharacterized protein n=1 Tax=Streptomyces polyrhachis TaxID=1282885 RepID=A0ABW2GE36_9ACTN
MNELIATAGVFSAGATIGAMLVSHRQQKLSAHLIDGRRIRIPCTAKLRHTSRWTAGRFVIEAGTWEWQPRSPKGELQTLPPDLTMAAVLPQGSPETRKRHLHAMGMECTSSQGDILIAVLPGQIAYLAMALPSTTRPDVE